LKITNENGHLKENNEGKTGFLDISKSEKGKYE